MKNYALITGASRGIGLELAKLFAKDGYPLILVARSKDQLEHIREILINAYHIDVVIMVEDLSIPYIAKTIYQNIVQKGLRVDYLVNNAGFGDYGPFLQASLECHYEMIQVNVLSVMELCHYFANDMKQHHFGHILNVGSIASFFPGPFMATYYASKAFVLSFSEALSKELRPYGIFVTVLCPGTTDTHFFQVANASSDKTDLLKHMRPASAYSVAQYGYHKMMKKKVIAVYGMKNRTAIFMNRLISRRLSRNIVYRIQNERSK